MNPPPVILDCHTFAFKYFKDHTATNPKPCAESAPWGVFRYTEGTNNNVVLVQLTWGNSAVQAHTFVCDLSNHEVYHSWITHGDLVQQIAVLVGVGETLSFPPRTDPCTFFGELQAYIDVPTHTNKVALGGAIRGFLVNVLQNLIDPLVFPPAVIEDIHNGIVNPYKIHIGGPAP